MPAVASSHTGLTPPASAGRVNSNVRPHTSMLQRARHHPSSLRRAHSFVPRAQRMQVSAPEQKTRSASVLPSTAPTQQRLESQSRRSASQRVARIRARLNKVSLLFSRRAEKPAFGQLGQRRREKTANVITTHRPGPATRVAQSPTRASQCGLTTSFNPDPLRQASQARSALVVASSQTGLATPASAGRVNSNVRPHTNTRPCHLGSTSPAPQRCSSQQPWSAYGVAPSIQLPSPTRT